MNNFDIDNKTKELFDHLDLEHPSGGFSKRVMDRIEKEKAYKAQSLFSQNLLIGIAVAVLYFGYHYFKTGRILPGNLLKEMDFSVYLEVLSSFFTQSFSMIDFSPFIIVSIAAIVILMLSDNILLRLMHSLRG